MQNGTGEPRNDSHTRSPSLKGRRGAVVLTAVLLGCQIAVLAVGIGGVALMDTLRAYVASEGLYSNAQKEAVHALYEFASLPDEPGLVRYNDLIAVPLAGKQAREILEDRERPVSDAYPFLMLMGHGPVDARGVAWLMRLFGETALLAPAIETWRKADEAVTELDAIARSLRSSRRAHPLELVPRNEFLIPIAQINSKLTELQAQFSRQIGEAANGVKNYVIVGMLAFGVLVVGGGIGLGWRTAARLRATQAALEEREQRFRDIAGTTADWVWETDPQLRFTYISPRIAQVTGFDQDHFLGKTREDVARFETEDLRKLHLANLEERRPFSGLEYALRSVEGEWRHVRIAGTPYYDPAGNFCGYRGAGTDITVTRRAEESILRARDAAEAANKAKSKFLATMSHELRTPLNAIIGFAQVIAEERFGPNSPRYTDYARDVWVSGEHLLRIINEILDLSRVEAGEMTVSLEPVNLTDTVESCMHMMRPEAEAAQITLTAALPANLPPVNADPQRLQQILLNLVSNAVKFSNPAGEVRVTAEVLPGKIRIAVSDAGIGMYPEEAEQVFTPFYQVDGELNRKYHGSGLGLPIVKHLVESHGGTIALTSIPQEGTTVTLELPAAEDSIGSSGSATQEEAQDPARPVGALTGQKL